ncbi:DgyrCDS14898 [Dimorphilus gyrociliatus]|uniref:DgyrCDS14898 n=1 Tax=Dimorphilus gyrociliatus TaxID=2664684 RepID=A0A7I8WF91_9ANNE|nr:DgyrCDS14898 [Dimorphilus gyrociliatus]
MKYQSQIRDLARRKKGEMTYKELEADLKISKLSLQYICENKREGKPDRRGRPPKANDRVKTLIKRECIRLQENKELATAEKIKDNLSLDVSERTILRILNKNRAKYLSILKVCPLSARAKSTQLSILGRWVQSQIEYKKVGKYAKKTFKEANGSLNIWGFIKSDGSRGLYKSNLNLEKYREILDKSVLENYNRDHVFVQDSAPCHTSRGTLRYPNEKNIRHLEDWTDQSPDLNPIENLWSYLKGRYENEVVEPNVRFSVPEWSGDNFKVISIEECFAVCNSYEECKAIDYKMATKRCHLKSSYTGKSYRDNFVLFVKDTQPQLSDNFYHIWENKVVVSDPPFVSPIWNTDYKAVSLDVCLKECNLHSGCKAIDYVLASRNCSLKTQYTNYKFFEAGLLYIKGAFCK